MNSMEQSEVLKYILDSGIINMDDVRMQLEMQNKKRILEQHEYSKWSGKNGFWYTYVKDTTKKDGRRLVKRTTEEKIDKVIIDEYTKSKERGITLEEIYPDWLSHKSMHTKRSSSIKRYTSEWKRFYLEDSIVKVPLKKLDKMSLDEWAHDMIKKYDMSKQQYFTMSHIMRDCMKYAKEKGYIEHDVFQEVKVSSKMFRKTKKKDDNTQVYLESEQIQIIKEAWLDFEKNPADTTSLAVILAFNLGTRPGETVAIKEADIKGNYVHIQRMEVGEFETKDGVNYTRVSIDVAEHTKTDAGDREVYMVAQARAVVETIKEVNRETGYTGDYLFVRDGERIKESAVSWRLEKYCYHIGIQFKSPHKMRKTYISTLIDNSVNINTIRKQVGHENEKTTYKNYCFDRKGEEQIENQLEIALNGDNEEKVIKGNQKLVIIQGNKKAEEPAVCKAFPLI